MRRSRAWAVAATKAAESISAAPTLTAMARDTSSGSWRSSGPIGLRTPALFTSIGAVAPSRNRGTASVSSHAAIASASVRSSRT